MGSSWRSPQSIKDDSDCEFDWEIYKNNHKTFQFFKFNHQNFLYNN